VLTRPRNPHTIVLVYAACQAVGLALHTSRASDPSTGLLTFGIVVDLLILWGLWLFERWLWQLVIALTLAGEVYVAIRLVQGLSAQFAVAAVLGTLEIGLLLHPSLRLAMRKR
jgi:hypothetical protein